MNFGIARNLPRVLCRLLAGLLIATAVFAVTLLLVSNASAKVKVPAFDPSKFLEPGQNPAYVLYEVMDFEPHYGISPQTIAGLPTIRFELLLSKNLWCWGPRYICVFGACWCIPLPYNWCYVYPKCLATNSVNLAATLLIKHAKPSSEGRLDEVTNMASIPDYYARDLCVSSAKLGVEEFNPDTGDVNAGGVLRYDERTLGLVKGAKPFFNSCMKTIDTPAINTSTIGNSGFSYYQNANNDPFQSDGTAYSNTIYGRKNSYLSTTFPLEGVLGCPKEIFSKFTGDPTASPPVPYPDPTYPYNLVNPQTPAEWKEKATKCYDYFILARATNPEWVLERPGASSDDPLTQDAPKGNPEHALFNSCQPLMDGLDADKVAKGETHEGKGFAKVMQYDRADLDEADYSPKRQLERSFTKLFPGQNMPIFQNIFPCVARLNNSGPMRKTDWDVFNTILIVNYAISFGVESGALGKNWGPMYFRPISNGDDYTSPGEGKGGFCPNVEKINIPSNPFSPRDDFKPLPTLKTSGTQAQLGLDILTRQTKLLASPVEYIWNDRATEFYSNDREYSYQTAWKGPTDRINKGNITSWPWMYSGWNDPAQIAAGNIQAMIEYEKHPPVMCAIVPVDILEPRRRAFDNCIMQRINYNFTTWRRRNFLSYYYKNSLAEWRQPCKTRFYEKDKVSDCPVNMSIQQCCRIIVKDVVPMNYVKIRTCEGLRQKRNLVFGYDHIFDATDRKTVDIDKSSDIQAAQAMISAGLATGNYPTIFAGEIAMSLAKIPETEVVETPIVGGSPNGIYMLVNDTASYDAAYAVNQTLTMIGCDNTEPDTYRFSHYFPLSRWSTTQEAATNLTIKPINDTITTLQQSSDDAVMAARQGLLGFLTGAAPGLGMSLTDAWYGLALAKEGYDTIPALVSAKQAAYKALDDEREAKIRYDNALKKSEYITSNMGVALTSFGYITPAEIGVIGGELLAAGIDLGIKKPLAMAAAGALAVEEKARDVLVSTALKGLRDVIEAILDTMETSIIANAKTVADNAIISGFNTLKTTTAAPIKGILDGIWNTANSTPPLALATAQLGAGGAHMPYMRWWDTGASAGNPIHGGSFINTLGSYDVIIGVGHEERNFDDATKDVDVITYQTTYQLNQPAIDAAQAVLDQKIRDLDDFRNGPMFQGSYNGHPRMDRLRTIEGTMAWNNSYPSWGRPISSPGLFCFPSQVGCVNLSLMTPAEFSNWLCAKNFNHARCNEYLNGGNIPPFGATIGLNPLRQAVADAQAALDNARIPVAVVTPVHTTVKNPMTLNPSQPLIQPSRMGRINGWDGLKGHQMWTTRRSNLACIGRYEQLFKSGGPEDFVLAKAGANYTSKEAGKKRGVPSPWPLGWRGYINASDRTIPGFGTIYGNEFEKNIAATGLDNAIAGDIIIFVVNGLKRIAYVTDANQVEPRFVRIESWDQGKFPTATGTGVSWGNGVSRTIYKTSVPKDKLILNYGGVATPIEYMQSSNVAKLGIQPSCEDPEFTDCVLGGAGNSGWNDVKIYRPSLDTDKRLCPMVEYTPRKKNVQTSELDTDAFAYCVNAGFDPPQDYVLGNFKGAGTGAISDMTLCGPGWSECASPETSRCFPGNTICSAMTLIPPPPPTPPDTTGCSSQEQYDSSVAAWMADIKALQDAVDAAKADLIMKEEAAASAVFESYKAWSVARLAEIDMAIVQQQSVAATPEEKADIAAAINDLQAKVADLNNKLAAVNAAVNDYNAYYSTNKPIMDSNQQIIDAEAPGAAQAQIDNQAIQDNMAALQNAIDIAFGPIDAAKTAVTNSQTALNSLPGIDTSVAVVQALTDERNSINQQLANLAQTKANADQAVIDAEQAVTDAETNLSNAPAMRCPYP